MHKRTINCNTCKWLGLGKQKFFTNYSSEGARPMHLGKTVLISQTIVVNNHGYLIHRMQDTMQFLISPTTSTSCTRMYMSCNHG